MANVDYPHGLNAVMSRFNDSPRLTKYFANVTTAIYRGDVVTVQANGRVATLTTTTGAANVIGVAANYNAAATTPAVQIWVYDDPDTVFETQSDGTTDPTLATSRGLIGATAALILTAGVAATGQSQHELDYTVGTTSVNALKIVGIYNQAGNDAALMHAKYLVVLHRHHLQKGNVGI